MGSMNYPKFVESTLMRSFISMARYYGGAPGQSVQVWIEVVEYELLRLHLDEDEDQAEYAWQGLVGEALEFYYALPEAVQYSWRLMKFRLQLWELSRSHDDSLQVVDEELDPDEGEPDYDADNEKFKKKRRYKCGMSVTKPFRSYAPFVATMKEMHAEQAIWWHLVCQIEEDKDTSEREDSSIVSSEEAEEVLPIEVVKTSPKDRELVQEESLPVVLMECQLMEDIHILFDDMYSWESVCMEDQVLDKRVGQPNSDMDGKDPLFEDHAMVTADTEVLMQEVAISAMHGATKVLDESMEEHATTADVALVEPMVEKFCLHECSLEIQVLEDSLSDLDDVLDMYDVAIEVQSGYSMGDSCKDANYGLGREGTDDLFAEDCYYDNSSQDKDFQEAIEDFGANDLQQAENTLCLDKVYVATEMYETSHARDTPNLEEDKPKGELKQGMTALEEEVMKENKQEHVHDMDGGRMCQMENQEEDYGCMLLVKPLTDGGEYMIGLIKQWCFQVLLSLMMSIAVQHVLKMQLCLVGGRLCNVLLQEQLEPKVEVVNCDLMVQQFFMQDMTVMLLSEDMQESLCDKWTWFEADFDQSISHRWFKFDLVDEDEQWDPGWHVGSPDVKQWSKLVFDPGGLDAVLEVFFPSKGSCSLRPLDPGGSAQVFNRYLILVLTINGQHVGWA